LEPLKYLMATIVVGDIHGNAVALERLLQSIRGEASGDDTIVFLGDYIDRGPDSRSCIQAILTLRESSPAEVICLRGNHEDWLLRTMADHSRHSWLLGMEAFDTISSYSPEAATALRSALADAGLRLYMSRYELPYHLFFDAVPASHLAFFSQLALLHQSPDCVCAHAGLEPEISDLAAQPASAVVWGNPSFPSGYSAVVPVVYGHWHKTVPGPNGWPIPHVEGNTICLDTSEYGVVTAIRMPERRVIQSNEFETQVSHLTV
jgi:serine/threonine protein phosphatase 1